TIDLVEHLQDGKIHGIFHCFSGSVAQAEKIAKLGLHVGIGGVATFKKGGLDEVLPEVPMDRIVLETDSPYLAPVPHRGKRNSPEYIPLIARRVADLMQLPLEEVAEKTTANTISLFKTYV
ncbi:MAG: TatD family hydrolase, partial [Bacteroidetes bacterium]|nr:TatD family hydrolase [Bacteroidota bacterium]